MTQFSKYIRSATDPMLLLTLWNQDPKASLKQLDSQVKYLDYDAHYTRHLRKLLKRDAPAMTNSGYKLAKEDVDAASRFHDRLVRSVRICRNVKRHPASSDYLDRVHDLGEDIDESFRMVQSCIDDGGSIGTEQARYELKPARKMIEAAPNALWRDRMKDVRDSINAVLNDAKHPDDTMNVFDVASELHDVDDDTDVNEDVWE